MTVVTLVIDSFGWDGLVMLIWGSDSGTARVGPAGQKVCPNCRQPGPCTYWVVYHYYHIYFELGLVTYRQYRIQCDRCRHSVAVRAAEVPPSETGKNPIPLLRRWGCLGGVIAILLLSLIGTAFVVATAPR